MGSLRGTRAKAERPVSNQARVGPKGAPCFLGRGREQVGGGECGTEDVKKEGPDKEEMQPFLRGRIFR